MDLGGSSGSCESKFLKIGFKFGQKIYFEDVGVGVQANSGGGSSTADGGDGDGDGGAQKKGRTEVGLQQQPPRCQVEGCNVDLSDAKTYYLRHKVCGVHSKTAVVIVNGVQQRFCQQCSRFHRLPEFDQGKRSCRRRLAGHNERRRKPPPGTIVSTRYGKLSSSILENHARPGGFVMDFSTVQWSNTRSSAQVANNNIPTRTEKLEPLSWQTPLAESPVFVNPSIISDCALSLLSNQSSGSRNQTLSLECYVNPGAPEVQPVSGGGTDGATMGQFSSTASWGYVANESYEVLQPGYLGEPELGQGASHYDSTDRVYWSV